MKKKKKNKSLKNHKDTNKENNFENNEKVDVENSKKDKDNIIELNVKPSENEDKDKDYFKSEDENFKITKFTFPNENNELSEDNQQSEEDFLEELNEFHDKYLEDDSKDDSKNDSKDDSKNDSKDDSKDDSNDEKNADNKENSDDEELKHLKNIKLISDDLIENFSEENEDGFLFYKMDEKPKTTWLEKQKIKYQNSKFARILQQISLKNKVAGFSFVFILIILIIFSIYYISPLSYASKVNVQGNYIVSNSDIIQTTGLKKNTRFWDDYFNQKQLLKKVQKKYPSVKNLTISIDHFNQVTINVEEYSWDGMLKVDDYYYPVLNNGMILKIKYPENEGNRLIFSNFNSEKLLREVIRQYEELPENIQDKIKEISYHPTKSNDLEMKLEMKDGNIVIISGNNFDNLKYYNKIADQLKNKSIIDMEVGIFAKPINSNSINNQQNNSIYPNQSQQEVVVPTN